jgi:hypothetical protein
MDDEIGLSEQAKWMLNNCRMSKRVFFATSFLVLFCGKKEQKTLHI